MIWYLCKSLWIIDLVYPTRLIFLAIGEVLSFGFNLAVLDPNDRKGNDTYCKPSRIKRWVYIILLEFIPLHHVILPNALLCSYELNTLDACWIVVDVWSNNNRCRIVSVYFARTWCLCSWSCLDILITMRYSINCSTVIRLPTVILMLFWEKPLAKPMAPESIFHHINLPSMSYFWRRLFCNLYFQSLS